MGTLRLTEGRDLPQAMQLMRGMAGQKYWSKVGHSILFGERGSLWANICHTFWLWRVTSRLKEAKAPAQGHIARKWAGDFLAKPRFLHLCKVGIHLGEGPVERKEGLRNVSTLVHEKQLLKTRVPLTPGPRARPKSHCPWDRGREQPLPSSKYLQWLPLGYGKTFLLYQENDIPHMKTWISQSSLLSWATSSPYQDPETQSDVTQSSSNSHSCMCVCVSVCVGGGGTSMHVDAGGEWTGAGSAEEKREERNGWWLCRWVSTKELRWGITKEGTFPVWRSGKTSWRRG